MLRKNSRKARRERLLKAFIKLQHSCLKRSRRYAMRQILQGADAAPSSSSSSPASVGSATSELSSDSEPVTSSSLSPCSEDGDSSGSLTSTDIEAELLAMQMDHALDDMPDLLPMGYMDSDDESDSDDDGSSDPEGDSGNEADNEEMLEDEISSRPRLARYVRNAIEKMYSQRYEQPRDEPIPQPPPQMPHVLEVLKVERPDQFREILRVNPATFDKIVDNIKGDPVFFNNSNNPQIPVEQQLAITLYQFGHDGNAASQAAVGRWAGGGKGSPSLHTKQVMTAVLRRSFMKQAVRFPTVEEKVKAKDWVEAHSCRAWRNGWLFVDGTLVPLFDRPHWYGESYFDRKCNYSLNIQVCLRRLCDTQLNLYLQMVICRLYHCRTYALLISVMAIQAVPMIQLHGMRPVSLA